MRKKIPTSVKMSVLAKASPPCEVCLRPTSFSRFTDIGSKRVGQFAHIRAVSEGGPRYDPEYPNDKIDSPENLFWCCTDCHNVVDDGDRWPIDQLLTKLNENRAKDLSRVELTVEGEVNVYGEDAESVTGIEAGGKPTVLRPGTQVNVSARRTKNVTGIKN